MTSEQRPQMGVQTADAPTGAIGLGQGVALYVCAILGAGVLVLPGQAASLAGPASLVAWLFSALIGVPLAFTFAALASRFPDEGGVATYTARAFGAAAGGVAGWWYFVAGSAGQAIVPLTAGYYISAALGLDQHWAPVFAGGVLLVAVLANLAGLKIGARVQVALALGVAGILIAVVLVALPQVDPAEFTPFAPHGVAGMGQAVIVLFFAFAGWEAIAHLSAEFRDVRRTLPAATLLTIVIVTVLYLGVALAVVGTGSYGDPALDRVSLGSIIEQGLGLSAAAVVAVCAVVICLGTTNAFVASVSRLGYALGRDRWAPRALARTARNGVPANAVLAVGGIGATGLLGSAIFGWGADDIVFIPAVLVLATYLLGSAAATKIFTGIQRVTAIIAVILLALTVPFAGWHLAVPLVIAAVVLLVQHERKRAAPFAPAPEQTARHFAARLAFETDASDVHTAQEAGERFVLVDVRGDAPWAQGRIVGAIHIPHADIAQRAPREIPLDMPVVVYCWGPGCNGAHRGALNFATLGYQVKEMLGGFEYWAREGYPVENDHGPVVRVKDPLTVPVDAATCAC